MEKTTIKKEIDINAPKEKVWNILLEDQYVRQWYAAFSEGAFAETDWQLGSKVLFKDTTNNGMIAKVVENTPNELLSVSYEGLLVNGEEDTQSDDAKAVQGGYETYRLLDSVGGTQLAIEGDMTPEYFDMMSEAWDKALLKIKELAEVHAN
ncbi:SRPBCC family protein [Rufibacter latericius]|uniref:SRPBCC domain-containing protein n=1 Tax=Rufibacter latericius TaxID=2487040 RepID=A0A3M9MU06_9BACT|nr:SRPBCC domain-containing protein [Rufibacter latericius]RNI28979.1 SRPBCC domain-containing protein [Rufibacter latericius]